MQANVLSIGVDDDFIEKLHKNNKSLNIITVSHFIKAMGYLSNNVFDVIFCTDKPAGMTAYKFLEIVKEIASNSFCILILSDQNEKEELKALKSGFDFVIDVSKDININLIYLKKISEYVLQAKGITNLNKDLVISVSTGEVVYKNKKIKLTDVEFEILNYLISNEGIVCSRQELFDHIQDNSDPTDAQIQIVDVYVYRLRRKIHNDIIKSVHGKGYIL